MVVLLRKGPARLLTAILEVPPLSYLTTVAVSYNSMS